MLEKVSLFFVIVAWFAILIVLVKDTGLAPQCSTNYLKLIGKREPQHKEKKHADE